MAQVLLHPRTPDTKPMLGATITAELVNQEGERVWLASPSASYAGISSATENPPGTYTLTLHPNTDLQAGSYYEVALTPPDSTEKLYQLINVPREGTFNLEDVIAMANGGTTGSGVTSGGVPFLASDEAKLDGIEAGAQRNRQSDWAIQDMADDRFIRNKPIINAQGQVVSTPHDTSLTLRNGRLGVTNPFTQADEDKLDSIDANAKRQKQSDWNQLDDSQVDYIKNKPFDGMLRLRLDNTFIGDAVTSELGIANPFTEEDEDKLDSIARGAEVNIQSDWAQTDTTAKDFIKNKPVIGNQGTVTSIPHDNTLTLSGTPATLKVTNPFTAADKLKLDGIEPGAEVNIQSDWNATSGDAQILNKPDIAGIAHGQLTPVDTLASTTITLQQLRTNVIGNNTLNIPFTLAGTTYEIRNINRDTENGLDDLTVWISPVNNRAALKGVHIEIGSQRFSLGDTYTYVANSGGVDAYEWRGSQSIGSVGGSVEVKIYEPLDVGNYVPGDGTDGNALFREGGKPEWKNILDTDIQGLPTVAEKTAGTAGQVLSLSAAKNRYELTDVSGGRAPTEPEVYTHAKQIIDAGTGIAVTDDDATRKITIKLGAADSGTTFPTSPTQGERFDLTAQATIPDPAVITVAMNTDRFGYYVSSRPFGSIDRPSTQINGVYWNDNTSIVRSNYRNRIILHTAVTSRTPASVTIGATTYPVARVSGLAGVYRSTSAVATNPLPDGTQQRVQVTFTDNSKAWPDITVPAGSYHWNGYHWVRWHGQDGDDLVRTLAALPQARKLPFEAIRGVPPTRFSQIVHDGSGAGLTVTNTASDTTTAFQVFSPVFDLTNITHGEFTVEVTYHLTTRSSNLIGFQFPSVQTYRQTDVLFASTLKALSYYSTSGITGTTLQVGNGVALHLNAADYNSSTHLGDFYILFGRNSNEQLGYVTHYEGIAGPSNVAISVSLGVDWNPADTQPIRSLFRGTWVIGVYNIGDEVLHSGVFYKARTARTAANTDAPGVDAEWRAMTT